MKKINYTFAGPRDADDIVQLLSRCQLPTDGIAPHLQHFILAKSRGKMIGVVGLEVYDIIGLLRSLAVMPEARKMGVGKDLCLREIAHAYTQNIDELYLLTTTAEGFFTKLGFEKIARRLSPAPLQTSIEFQKLCPDSAV